jgi:hypothetical protein
VRAILLEVERLLPDSASDCQFPGRKITFPIVLNDQWITMHCSDIQGLPEIVRFICQATLIISRKTVVTRMVFVELIVT